jgi:hypothetical protein
LKCQITRKSSPRFSKIKHTAVPVVAQPRKQRERGQKKSGKTRKGNPTLKKTLVQCGKSASKNNKSYFNSMYGRIASRRGRSVAAVAVARKILEVCYCMIRDNTPYSDLGADCFTERNRADIAKGSVKKLQSLGFSVTIEDTAIDIA